MSSLGIRLRAETIKTLAFGSIGANYAAIGTALAHPSSLLVINNATNAPMLFSFDGVNDHVFIATGGVFECNAGSNKGLGGGFFLSAGTIIYVKQVTAPSSGSVYVSSFYAQN